MMYRKITANVTNCFFINVDLRVMVFTLFRQRRSTKDNYVMACFMELAPCFFQMEASMKEYGTMVLQLK